MNKGIQEKYEKLKGFYHNGFVSALNGLLGSSLTLAIFKRQEDIPYL
jgi:hypothetical protein